MKRLALLAAAPLVFVQALASSFAHASSGAPASASFNALSGLGFAWLGNPVATVDNSVSVSVAGLTGFDFGTGVFKLDKDPVQAASCSGAAVGVPISNAAASADCVFDNAFSFGVPMAATLKANALVSVFTVRRNAVTY